jgi:membrane protein required for beta-lactamase induction
MSKDPHLAILIELKESMARVEQKVESRERDIQLGVEAYRKASKLETERSTIWAAIVAIPIIAGAIAFFMPDLPPSRDIMHR